MLDLKYKNLADYNRRKGSVLVAFSGGVDSSVLAATAFKAVGRNALAVTIDSPLISRSELKSARDVAKGIGIRHWIVRHSELSNKKFSSNPKNRCYYCKKELAKVLKDVARERGVNVVLEGTNAEDLLGHRPGYKALREAGVESPLASFKFTKQDVRDIARRLHLKVHGKPSTACLASRIPYGTRITKDKLRRVEAAEDLIRKLGVSQLRVRFHGSLARIEVNPEDFEVIFKNRKKISRGLIKLGFKNVALDLKGYRTGSMN